MHGLYGPMGIALSQPKLFFFLNGKRHRIVETLVVVAAAKPDDFTNTVEPCARQIGSCPPGRGEICEPPHTCHV